MKLRRSRKVFRGATSPNPPIGPRYQVCSQRREGIQELHMEGGRYLPDNQVLGLWQTGESRPTTRIRTIHACTALHIRTQSCTRAGHIYMAHAQPESLVFFENAPRASIQHPGAREWKQTTPKLQDAEAVLGPVVYFNKLSRDSDLLAGRSST